MKTPSIDPEFIHKFLIERGQPHTQKDVAKFKGKMESLPTKKRLATILYWAGIIWMILAVLSVVVFYRFEPPSSTTHISIVLAGLFPFFAGIFWTNLFLDCSLEAELLGRLNRLGLLLEDPSITEEIRILVQITIHQRLIGHARKIRGLELKAGRTEEDERVLKNTRETFDTLRDFVNVHFRGIVGPKRYYFDQAEQTLEIEYQI